MSPTTLTFALYMAAMLAIGWYAWRVTRDSAGYFLGGRQLGPFPAALSAGASDMSGWLLLGLPGLAYAAGVSALWLAAGLLAGTWLNWLLVARRLRVYSASANDALTIPEFFANRFGDPGHRLQVVAAAFVLLFFLFYTSAGLVAAGKLFQTVFGLPYLTAVLVGAGAILSYTLFGGFLAVSWTDVVQGLLMSLALVVVPLVAIAQDGGPGAMLASIAAHGPALLDPWRDADGALTWLGIASLAGWGLGYFGQPHVLARFAGIRAARDVPTARRIAVTWTGLGLGGALLVGLAGFAWLANQGAAPLADPETVFMVLVDGLFHPVLGGVLLAAILAAIMSTADSQLLVASAALAEDLYRPLLRSALGRDPGRREVMWVGRLAVLLVAAVATALAAHPGGSVLGLVAYAWAGFGASFGPVLVASLYWSRMNRVGAIAGVIAGGLTVVLWKEFARPWLDLYEIIPGVLAAVLAIVVVSLATAPPGPAVRAGFAEYRERLREAG